MTNEGAIRDLVEHADRVVANLHFRLDDPGFWESDAIHRQRLIRRLGDLLEEIMMEAPHHRERLARGLAQLRSEYVGRALANRPYERPTQC